MMINIISNDTCEVKVDVVGTYGLSLNSVSGMFYPIILTNGDYINIKDDKNRITNVVNESELINISMEGVLMRFQNLYQAAYLVQHGEMPENYEFIFEPETNAIYFPGIIVECSPNALVVFGITSLPTATNQYIGSTNGPQFIFIKCDELSSPMRYCNQLEKDSNKYAAITNILSITLNTFSTGYPFSLQGNQFVLDSNQLSSIKMQIVDIHGNPISFKNNLLWNFQLDKISEEIILLQRNDNEQ